MMLEFYRELESGNGPVFLKLDHLAEETIREIEQIQHTNERPSRGRFHERRGTDYREKMVEMHISEIGLCSGHSASGVWVNEHARTTVPGLYMEYKLRRMVNDYLQPPKVTTKMEIGLKRFEEIRDDTRYLYARDPHELRRAMEVHSILDCAEMAARASLFRKESRWGLYHYRVDYPEMDQDHWLVHAQVKKDDQGRMTCFKRAVEPYIVELDEADQGAYSRLRIAKTAS
jgi:succinate dehydrogenase/fumarate reductase flavoprotein subunit